MIHAQIQQIVHIVCHHSMSQKEFVSQFALEAHLIRVEFVHHAKLIALNVLMLKHAQFVILDSSYRMLIVFKLAHQDNSLILQLEDVKDALFIV